MKKTPEYVRQLTSEEAYVHGYDDGIKDKERELKDEQERKQTIPTSRFI